MRRFSVIATSATLALGLAPLSAFAATDAVSEEEVLNVIEAQEGDAMLMDRGGGAMSSSMYYPGPYGNGITVDANVTREVTPDFIAVNGYCEVTNMDDRDEVRAELTRIYNEVKSAVGSDGRVRRGGPPSVYPFYDGVGAPSGKFSGSVSIFIRVLRTDAAQRISEILEQHACSPSWDVRLVNTEDHELGVLDDLLAKVNKRKAVFEKLLAKKLNDVVGASLSTWVDGWSSYDPETNKADATTTLSITFGIGTKTKLVDPAATRKETRMGR